MIVLPSIVIPLSPALALRTLTISFTRDGEQTDSPKVALMMTRELLLQAVFSGSVSGSSTFLASAVDTDWLLVVVDMAEPRRSASRYLRITENITVAVDLNDGTGSGAVGSPASLGASVRVAGLDVERTVVAVEQQSDGAWRVAGSGRTDAQGDAMLDLRVTPSSLMYALALDDWGTPFQIDQMVTVGMTIRPSVFAGWLYRITEAGQLPSVEPPWWPIDGDNAPRELGTARAVAVRYYRPLAHGPVPVEVI